MLPVAAGVLAGAGGTAFAVAQARANATQPVAAVATFGAQALLTATSSQSGPLVLPYTVNSDNNPREFVVKNTGTLAQSGQTWQVTVTNTGGGTKGNATITTCLTPFTVAGLCSGLGELPVTVGTVAEGTPATFTTTNPVAAGAVFYGRFTPTQVRLYNATISMSVSRAQAAPAAQTTSS